MDTNKLQELYQKLFQSDALEIYVERLGNIVREIKEVGEENYLPTKLKLFEDDFPGPCSAYVCISNYNYTWHANGINHFKCYPVGIVLARHHHWNRDYYLNHYTHDAYVSGGPLERPEHRVNWFPIYHQANLMKAVDYMIQLHHQHILKMLSDEKEGFLNL